MARMSVDDSVARDPRITMLSKLLGWTRRETLGCLVGEVWPICYDQVTHLVSPKLIDTAAEHVGFAEAMVECELARRDRSGKVHINGAADRVKYIRDKQDAGREGGLKSGESRRSTPKQQAKQEAKQEAKQPEAGRNPPVNPSVPVPVPPSAPVPDPVSPPVEEKSIPDVRRVTDAFQAYFVRRTGSKPTWGSKSGAHIQQLLKAHGADEVVRRVGVLDAMADPFPAHPWDFAAFRQHFDKCATEQRRPQPKGGNGFSAVLRIANGVDK